MVQYHCLSFVPRHLINLIYPNSKFSYVLLRDRNMILNLKYEANGQGFIMTMPEILKKVTECNFEQEQQKKKPY